MRVSLRVVSLRAIGLAGAMLLASTTIPIACTALEESGEVESTERGEALLYLVYQDAADTVQVVAISADGRLTPVAADTPSVSAPLLSGLTYNTIATDAYIPTVYLPLLASLADLRERLPAIYAGIREVTLINKSRTTYEVRLSTLFTTLPIISAVPISADNLQTVLIAVSNLSLPTDELTYVSIRGAVPVLRYDEP